VSRVRWRGTVDGARLAEMRLPRDDVVREEAVGGDRFEGREGPFDSWRRELEVTPAGDGVFAVVERIEYRLAVRYWWWLLAGPTRDAARRPRHDGRQPWWAPPARLDARAANAIDALAVLALVTGFLGTLVGQTMTFAADEFGVSDQAQSNALASIRIGVLFALALTILADRLGRRRVLLAASVAGIVVGAAGALAPSLLVLTITQLVGRSFATTLGTLVPVVAAEELPAGSRAWGLSVLALAGSLGAGIAVMALPLADLGERGWRLVYLIPLLALPLVVGVARRLPESIRFERHRDRRLTGDDEGSRSLRGHRRRFVMLAAVGFLVALMVAPAAQLRNEYLRDDRGFSATQISLFVIATNTPGGIGILLGGRLADRRGRKHLGAIALAGGAIGTALFFLADGWGLWGWALASTLVGAAAIPALRVYEPELFPTGLRGRAGGWLAVVSLVGSTAGLVVTGFLTDVFDDLGTAIAVLVAGPVLAAVVIVTTYPETVRLELEELNPEDADGAAPGPSPPPAPRSPDHTPSGRAPSPPAGGS
jgi:MFS family permease